MQRPIEYENLIKSQALEAVAATPGAIAGFLANAEDYKSGAHMLDASMKMQVFTLAYEGYFQLVQAVLEFYGVRAKDAGRNLVIQRVSSSLGLDANEFSFITTAHKRRNGMSYSTPFPPVTRAEAATMRDILSKYLPAARRLTQTP